MEQSIRQLILRLMTGERALVLRNKPPSEAQLREKLRGIDSMGLYLHIPFCQQICPYCPYNKQLYRADLAEEYVGAVKKEMDFYSALIDRKPITSVYIGGGTPTILLDRGLGEIIAHMRRVFEIRCEIHLESHPNHLSRANLENIREMGVQHLSMGVEALFDRHLRFLRRPYTVEQVRESVRSAVSAGFKCVNVDVMFALPGQTYAEIEQTGRELVELGVDQVAAYPLFRFPYTALGKASAGPHEVILQSFRRRRMLRVLERIFYRAGYERTSAWAFTRRGVPRYCSVTVPLYLGLGASGGSYLKDVFYLNTFSVAEYIKAMRDRGTAMALSIDLTESMQRAGWLYWRLYETRFDKSDYRARFGEEIEHAYGTYLAILRWLGFVSENGERTTLSDRGSFWLHACEDILSIDYIGKLWGALQREPWPEEVVL